MPWCQNESCKKTGLHPDEIVFDDSRQMIICKGCSATSQEPGLVVSLPPKPGENPRIEFGIHITSKDGVSAEVRYNDVAVRFKASPEDLKKLVGMEITDGSRAV